MSFIEPLGKPSISIFEGLNRFGEKQGEGFIIKGNVNVKFYRMGLCGLDEEGSFVEWITAEDIADWTRRKPEMARERLPQLVGRLILASKLPLENFNFPFRSGVQYPGYDGFLRIENGTDFIPGGTSVWEMGTNESVYAKFHADCQKRAKKPGEIRLEETTFCFVTSRIWNAKTDMGTAALNAKREFGWKNVRIYDAQSLAEWLAQQPDAAVWFCELIGRKVDGLFSPEAFWQMYAESTEPALRPEFFLHQRKPLLPQIHKQLGNGSGQILLSGASRQEIILTLCAECMAADSEETQRLAARFVIAADPEAFKRNDLRQSEVIWIPMFQPGALDIPQMPKNVIFPIGRSDPLQRVFRERSSIIEIPKRTRGEFAGALEAIGCSLNDAWRLAGEVHCDFDALFRKWNAGIAEKIPEWAERPDKDALIPALLTGTWEANLSGDRRFIESLAGESWETYQKKLGLFLQGENVPLLCKGDFYTNLSIGESWAILGKQVTKAQIQQVVQELKAILLEETHGQNEGKDPMLAALTWGNASACSDVLKKAASQTLIYWRLHGPGDECDREMICKIFIQEILQTIQNAEQWRRAAELLPIWVEAAPDAVLSVLKENIRDTQSSFWELLETNAHWWSRTFYHGVIQALQKAAWMRSCTGKTIRLLAELASSESEKAVDEAVNTLYEIFCLWHPQGALSAKEREDWLMSWIREAPVLRRQLIPRLVIGGFQSCGEVCRPEWQPAENWLGDGKANNRAEITGKLTSLYLKSVGSCWEDWEPVFVVTSGFPMEEAVKRLAAEVNAMTDEDQVKAKKCLAAYISRENQFPNALWRQSDTCLHHMEVLYEQILADSPLRYVPWFMRGFHGLHAVHTSDWEAMLKQMNETEAQQRQIIRELYDEKGMADVLSLLPWIEDAEAWAKAATAVLPMSIFNWALLEQLRENFPEAAEKLAGEIGRKDLPAFDKVIKELQTAQDKKWMFSCLPITEETVKYAEECASKEWGEMFWKMARIDPRYMREGDFAKICIQELVAHHRAVEVIQKELFIWCQNSELIAEALLAVGPETAGMKKPVQLDILPLLKVLQEKKELPVETMAALEWTYLPYLLPDFEPHCLTSRILQAPAFYMELIAFAYRDDDGNYHGDESCTDVMERAWAAFQHLKRIPGQCADGESVDENVFGQWIKEAAQLAKQRRYTVAHACMLGKILSYAPKGSDGIWPTECVREVIEQEMTDTLVRNMVCERRNQRGVYCFSGGREEEKLADFYDEQAKLLSGRWPGTANMLRMLASDYNWDAEREAAEELKRM